VTAQIEVIPAAAEQAPILANLLELYAHDFSAFYDVELGPDGRFGYKQLPLYWSEPARHPFLVRVEGKLAGFVLVRRGSEVSGDASIWDMAEFFVIRGYRRRGIGTHVAHQVWRQFPGRWEVRVLEENVSARHFWERAISQFAEQTADPVRVDHNGDSWTIFSFGSK